MNDQQLDDLFRRYRGVCPDPEASADFMPRLWQKIDARRSFTWKLRLYARNLVAAAAMACMAVGVFEASTGVNPFYTKTYLEALDDEQPAETLAYADVLHVVDVMGGSESR